MPVKVEADRLPFDEDTTIYFRLSVAGVPETPEEIASAAVETATFGNTPLTDMEYAGELYSSVSYLRLPLLDYHDDIDPGLLDSLTPLHLEAPEEVVRLANPGKTLAYYFEVLNKGDQADTVEWLVEGPQSEWASVVPGFSDVDAYGRATVAIRVDIPADALREDVADLLLVGQSTENPDTQVFGHFQAIVETEADIPDESSRFAELQSTAQQSESQGAPFPTFIVLVGVALAAILRRRF
jgi:hypothetical protein